MTLEQLEIGDGLGLDREDAVVCIPVYGAYDLFAECLLSVLRHTDPRVHVMVCDDASPDRRIRDLLETHAHWPHVIHYLQQARNVGFVENVNAAIAAAAPADLVILNSDCVVADGWFTGLRDAAYSESRVATATALTNAGTIVSVPYRNRPVPRLPDGLTPDRAAALIREASLRLRPDLPTCIGHCVYLRRSALELVGPFDPAFSPGYEEEVDFSQRCVLHGLRHVLADDVFVFHRHMSSFGTSDAAARRRDRHHEMIVHRYPYFDRWCQMAELDDDSPLARALSTASRAFEGTSVTIDGRCLTHSWTGTQLVTLGVIDALDKHTSFRVRVLVPPDLGHAAAAFLAGRPRIEVFRSDQLANVPRSDVVHRPYQVSSADDLKVLRALGRRTVLSQLDNIALRNPGYFTQFDGWREYLRLNRVALAAADQVVFISRHGADDARALELIEEERINVVAPDTEASVLNVPVADRPLPEVQALAGRPFLLCLGTDFLHKNRVFAIRLFRALIADHAFDGALVFAGPKVASGSSGSEEARYLLEHPELAQRVFDVGAVDERDKNWLLQQASALMYPTTYEGFGLTPFEAAELGTPCVFASHTSLAEVLPARAALMVPWDPEETARRMAPVLVEGAAREQLVRTVKLAGARFTVQSNGLGLEKVYKRALLAPARQTFWLDVAELRQELDLAHQELDVAQRELGDLYGIVYDPLNRGLVGPDAVLPSDLRRAVLAIATRPSLRASAIALYRLAYGLRHGPRRHAHTRGSEA
jgi:GT2 family glycosyltransferase